MARVGKRKKTHQEEKNRDRLSELPDALLVEILSSLEMKDCVRTSILSKRWQRLWALVHNIVLDFNSYYSGSDLQNFFSSVGGILTQCARPSFKKLVLSLDLPQEDYVKHLLDECLECVLSKKIEALKLEFLFFDYLPPECLYDNSSFINLELAHFRMFESPEVVSWSSLKSLYLDWVSVSEKMMSRIISGCPVLESLVLDHACNLSHLNITSPSVKTLKILNYENVLFGDVLEINAPWLQQLEVSGTFYNIHFRLVDISSLKIVNISFILPNGIYLSANFLQSWLEMVARLLESIQHVEEVIIGSLLIKALSILKALRRYRVLFKCKHLTVQLPVSKDDLPGMACFLQRSPNLETLVLKVMNQEDFGEPLNGVSIFYGDECLSLQKDKKFSHLKNVEVVQCRNSCSSLQVQNSTYQECFDFELVMFLLQNASFLEKLVITAEKHDLCICSPGSCASQYVFLLCRKLMGILMDEREVTDWKMRRRQSTFEFRFGDSCSKFA